MVFGNRKRNRTEVFNEEPPLFGYLIRCIRVVVMIDALQQVCIAIEPVDCFAYCWRGEVTKAVILCVAVVVDKDA